MNKRERKVLHSAMVDEVKKIFRAVAEDNREAGLAALYSYGALSKSLEAAEGAKLIKSIASFAVMNAEAETEISRGNVFAAVSEWRRSMV